MTTLSGIPTQAGTYNFTIQCQDSGGHTTSKAFTLTIAGAPPPPPPPGPAPPKRWQFTLNKPQPDGTVLAAITQARTRSFTVRQPAGSYHEVNLDLDGADPAAVAALPLATDVQVLLEGVPLVIARLGTEDDTLDGTEHRYAPVALDYKEVLRRRAMLLGGPNFATPTDKADVAWDLIRNAANVDGFGHPGIQNYPGGNLGISRGQGSGGTGTTSTANYVRSQFVGTEIDTLAQQGVGFDWDIGVYGPADLRLDIWPNGRGADKGVVLAYGGGMVKTITRHVDPSAYGDSVFVTGQSTGATTTVESNSDGGTIANIGSWSSPSPGVLDVASVDGFNFAGEQTTGGGLKVHCSGHTNAYLTYTGVSGSTFTGCQYVSGSPSGTVSKGASVWQAALAAVQLDAPDIATRAEGRWDVVIGMQKVYQQFLDDAAAFALAAAEVILPSYTIVLQNGAWRGPDHIWIGDYVTVWISSGRLQVNDLLPVSEMQFDLDANNVETVTLTVGRPVPKDGRRIKLIERSLLALETQ